MKRLLALPLRVLAALCSGAGLLLVGTGVLLHETAETLDGPPAGGREGRYG